ncbi:hypothetical protein HXY32_00480 [Candidatus Bathyarchaeota archaeon]|nr:hypothetical protein [Candidatus Bathyarchaeota archaeon]
MPDSSPDTIQSILLQTILEQVNSTLNYKQSSDCLDWRHMQISIIEVTAIYKSLSENTV